MMADSLGVSSKPQFLHVRQYVHIYGTIADWIATLPCCIALPVMVLLTSYGTVSVSDSVSPAVGTISMTWYQARLSCSLYKMRDSLMSWWI